MKWRPGKCACCERVSEVCDKDSWCGDCIEDAAWEPPCDPPNVHYPQEVMD